MPTVRLNKAEQRILEHFERVLDGARTGADGATLAKLALSKPKDLEAFLKKGAREDAPKKLRDAVALYEQAQAEFMVSLHQTAFDLPSAKVARLRASDPAYMSPSERMVAKRLEDSDEAIAVKIARACVEMEAQMGLHLSRDSKLGGLGDDGPYTVLEAESFALFVCENLPEDQRDALIAEWRAQHGPAPKDSRSALFVLRSREEELDLITREVEDALDD